MAPEVFVPLGIGLFVVFVAIWGTRRRKRGQGSRDGGSGDAGAWSDTGGSSSDGGGDGGGGGGGGGD